MTRFRFLISVAAAALALATPVRALNVEVSDFKLANGMEVVVIPDHRAPVVTHMVWYRVGAADEQSGKSGLAHFFEHLMFKGTPTHPEGEFNRIVQINGGDDNAFTSTDYTAYYQRVAANRLDTMMALEADRMQNLTLTDAVVKPERDVVVEERRQTTENDPGRLLVEQVSAAMYTAHPYGRPIVGWMSEVTRLTGQDALDFYRAHYTPANAILVVAGDVTAEEVKRLAEKNYGPLKNTFIPSERLRTPEPDPIAARRVIMTDSRAATPSFQRSYLAVAAGRDPGLESEALDVLAEILGGGSQGRLYKELVVKQKIASAAGAWYSGEALDYGTFALAVSPANGASLATIESAIDAEIARISRDGPTADELAKARQRILDANVYALDSQFALARMFGAGLTTGSSISDIKGWDERIAKVSSEDVKAAAAATLKPERSVTATLSPKPAP